MVTDRCVEALQLTLFFLKKYLISFSRLSLKTCQKHKPCYGSHPSCLLHQQNGPKNFINQQFNFLHLLMWYHDDRDILYLPIWLWSEVKRTLLMIIVPYRHYIGKCLFFHRHSSDKIYSLKLHYENKLTKNIRPTDI